MLKRTVNIIIKKALEFSPVVLIAGARQIGKSTLVMQYENREYVVMDDVTQKDAALSDPQGYITKIKKPVTIDEIQKVPSLLEPIKLVVDEHRKIGEFLLTGSANVLSLKNSNETLAGRLIEIVMFPLSAKEKNSKPNMNVVDDLFDSIENLKIDKSMHKNLFSYIVEGGYPASFTQKDIKNRSLWFNSYISTYIERDIRSIGELRDVDVFIKFFNLLIPKTAKLLNKSSIQNEAGISSNSIENYISLLKNVYQISELKPYHTNIGKRFIKSSKLYMNDSGILSHLLGIIDEETLLNSRYKGMVVETFVFAEILKHLTYSKNIIQMYHYRTHDRKEIDLILQSKNKVLAIEVKSASSVTRSDFKHILDFQSRSNEDIIGIVFYSGKKIVPFGTNLYAIPMTIFL